MLVTPLLVLATCARLQGEARAAPTLGEARARIQALAAAPGNELAPFRPRAFPGEDPRPDMRRAVPAVSLSTPWKEGEVLWQQVPEHVWTHLASAPEERRRLFSGEDQGRIERWGAPPFPVSLLSEWRRPEGDDGEGALEFRGDLEGGVTVTFQVLPGDRMFELRFGLDNQAGQALLGTWPQFCNAFTEFGTLGSQAPTSTRFPMDDALVDWTVTGQDLSWIERVRDPASGRIVRGCCLLGLVRGCRDERFRPDRLHSTGQMWLARPLDLPLLVRSSSDGRRHLVLYSPSGRNLMNNLLAPCAHVDPYLERVEPGQTRWGVLYGIFHEGELDALLDGLAAADADLRQPSGFASE